MSERDFYQGGMMFTKGPWEVGGPYPGVSVIFMADAGYGGPDGGAEPPRYEAICIVDGRTEGEQSPEALANAHLIAQAPRMYRALEDIAKGMASIPDEVLERGREAVSDFMWTHSQERARAAISQIGRPISVVANDDPEKSDR